MSIEQSTRYHLYPDMEILEIVDVDSGEAVGEGESGEVVYTSLDWRGSVVLRYRTGDYARGGIVTEPCPVCGRSVPRLTADLTRLSDRSELRLSKVKGTLVDFNEFFSILNDATEVVEWQVEITKRNEDPNDLDEIHIHLAVTSKCDQGELIQYLRRKMRERMELLPTQIHFRSAAEMADRLQIDTRPKEMRIIDRRPELLAAQEEKA
jgi:phenylacetate-coenzyme A ligase PaaK-like adenylate-forming protein